MTRIAQITKKTEAEVFGEAIKNADDETPLYFQLVKHFADEMYKAIKGRICTPERMAILYPIFREINIEQDEIKEYWEEFEIKAKRREAKRQAKREACDAGK